MRCAPARRGPLDEKRSRASYLRLDRRLPRLIFDNAHQGANCCDSTHCSRFFPTTAIESSKSWCNAPLVDDSLRVMLRIRAIYRSRAIVVKARSVYHPARRSEWLEQITDGGGHFRAEQLYIQLDLLELCRRTRTMVLRQACNQRAYRLLRTVPGIGPLRAAEIIAIIGDPHRFRTKRQLWAYAGLGVITRSSGEWIADSRTGRIRRSSRPPLTRGLNPNFNRPLKKIFKMAAHDVTGRPGELDQSYERMIDRGMRPEMAYLTLARKIATIVLAVWKKGASYDPRLIAQSVVEIAAVADQVDGSRVSINAPSCRFRRFAVDESTDDWRHCEAVRFPSSCSTRRISRSS